MGMQGFTGPQGDLDSEFKTSVVYTVSLRQAEPPSETLLQKGEVGRDGEAKGEKGKEQKQAGCHRCSTTGPMGSQVPAPSFRRRTLDPLDESGS